MDIGKGERGEGKRDDRSPCTNNSCVHCMHRIELECFVVCFVINVIQLRRERGNVTLRVSTMLFTHNGRQCQCRAIACDPHYQLVCILPSQNP